MRHLNVIVGSVQKSGTTSLYHYFCGHAGLRAPIRKELHFFDNERIDWSKPDYDLLHSKLGLSDGKQLSFDITPIYLFWPPSLARVHTYNPFCKLIFIFRDPIERAWSHWRMERRRQKEDMPFDHAIRQGRDRLTRVAPLDPAWRVFSYVERGFYASQLRRLFDLFPRDQILLLRSLDLHREHLTVLDQIAEFLDIAPFAAPSPQNAFQAPDDESNLDKNDVDYLREIFRDEVLEFAALSGLRVDDWLTIQGS